MIIQSKENKSQSSLIDLLGGNTKNSSPKSNDLFSKLLSTFGIAIETKTLQKNDSQTLTVPKTVTSSSISKELPKEISSVAIKSDFSTRVNETVQKTTSQSSKKSSDSKHTVLEETSQSKNLKSLLFDRDSAAETDILAQTLPSLDTDQLRTLLYKAKDYLKQEILAKAPEYKTEEPLPKTLKGLIALADKLGLKPESITLGSFISNDDPILPAIISSTPTQTLLETKSTLQSPIEVSKNELLSTPISELIRVVQTKNETKNESLPLNETTHEEPSYKDQPLKALLQSTPVAQKLPIETPTSPQISKEPLKEDIKLSLSPDSKAEALISLLKGESEPVDQPITSSKETLESTKTTHILKSESLEVKSKEATQSMRYFATDIKEAVQDYKPPFTRVSMKLNPEKLGEVEVTLVQRGNNVHVNIQSNNSTTIAFLAHNATELKSQLAHQGITNTTMNFMSGGENPSQNNAQQQEHRQHTFKMYESFEELDLNEEQLSALEIIIPHYA